jgi:hypothetical protein
VLVKLLLSFKHLAAIDFLISIGCDEFLNHHIAASYTNYQFPIHDLGEDFTGTKEIVSVAKALDRYLALHHVDVLSKLLINGITLESRVSTAAICSKAVDPKSLLHLIKLSVFFIEDVLNSVDLVFS